MLSAMTGRRDADLERRISPPAKDPADNEGLRSLWVQRLTEGAKLVWRRSLRSAKSSVYCEPCGRWKPVTDIPKKWRCPGCGRRYRVEFAVYEEMVDE